MTHRSLEAAGLGTGGVGPRHGDHGTDNHSGHLGLVGRGGVPAGTELRFPGQFGELAHGRITPDDQVVHAHVLLPVVATHQRIEDTVAEAALRRVVALADAALHELIAQLVDGGELGRWVVGGLT